MSAMTDPLPAHEPDDREESDALPLSERIGDAEPPPDFLAGVQAKIHARSGGKFYRSRWSTSPMSTLVQIVTLAMLLAIVLIWLFSGPVRDLGPDTAGPAPATRGVDGREAPRPPVRIESKSSGSGSPGSPTSPPPR